MHSPGVMRDGHVFGNDLMGAPQKKKAFSVRRLAHALWPSFFERPPVGTSPSPAPAHSSMVFTSATPLPTGFGGGGKPSSPAAFSSASSRHTTQRWASASSQHNNAVQHAGHISLAPVSLSPATPGGHPYHDNKHSDTSSLSSCSAALERIGEAAVALWLWLAVFFWTFVRGSRRAVRKVGNSVGIGGRGRHSGRRRRGQLDDDTVRGAAGARQPSEASLTDDSPSGTPTIHLRGLVLPPQGERKAPGRKRRNVYYDVEEASYRPMHRLLFMRERSINPVSQKKYDLAAAAATMAAGIGGGRSPHPDAAGAGASPSIDHTRQLSDSLLGIGTGGVSLSPALFAPQAGQPVPFGARGEYALTMGGDSAQILLASPIAGLPADEAGIVGNTVDGGTAGNGTAAGDSIQQTADETQPLSAAEGGYFAGKYGDRVCDGTFILVSQLGSGAFSTVWLAIDVRGATSAIGPGLMFQNRMDDTRYNATAAVMKQGFAFVVLKISRSALPYRQACEKEFETHQELYLRLQREGFDVSKFLLFPLSMREEAPNGQGPCHSVQVGAACGPSLLSFVLHAAPTALASHDDKLWRMRFIRQFMRNAIEGLAQLHSCGILHTDVKPENLLLTLPAYEVLRKMKAEPLLRDSKGRLYRASTGQLVSPSQGAGENTAADGTSGQDAASTNSGANDNSQKKKTQKDSSSSSNNSGKLSLALSGLTTEEEENDRDLIFAKNRLDLFNGVGTWVTLRQRHSSLMATEEEDVIEALGAIKVADLGNAVFSSNVRIAELQLKNHHSVSERNELLMATSTTHAVTSANGTHIGVPDPAALQQTAHYFEAAAAAHAFQTREYRAPEIIVGVQPLTRMLTPAMDVWSVGCLIFELITGSYLFNPHAAVQQEINNGIHPPDPEFRHNEVHLSMMQEICSTAPTQQGGGNANGDGASAGRTFSNGGGGTNSIPEVIRCQGRMSEKLFRSMLPIAPDSLTGEPLLQLILEQRTFCDPNRRGEDAIFRDELRKVAQMLGSIFRWEPLERPSMSDLLAMSWLNDDC